VAPGPKGVTKLVFTGGGDDAMQAKGKKLKSRWSFNKKLEGISLQGGALQKTVTSLSVTGQLKKECIRARLEMAQGMTVNNQWPQGEGARFKGFTVQLQPKKKSR